MPFSVIIFVKFFALFHTVFGDVIAEKDCDIFIGTTWSINLSIQSKRDNNGEWITTFSACKDYSNSSKSLNLDLKQEILNIKGKQIIYVKGTLKDAPKDEDIQKLRFFHKGGKFAVISNDGMMAFRENADKQIDHASILTNRPLKKNELFEVRVDKKLTLYPHSPIGIGVTTHSPHTFEFPGYMGQVISGTWMLFDKVFLRNTETVTNKYGEGFTALKPGDRLGVMRTETGTLHFFINGADQGAAASGIPDPVYGVVDLIRNVPQVTIIDRSSNCSQ